MPSGRGVGRSVSRAAILAINSASMCSFVGVLPPPRLPPPRWPKKRDVRSDRIPRWPPARRRFPVPRPLAGHNHGGWHGGGGAQREAFFASFSAGISDCRSLDHGVPFHASGTHPPVATSQKQLRLGCRRPDHRNRSSDAPRINSVAEPSSVGSASPRTTATGIPRALPFTRSAAAAISSATATSVTSRTRS